jgi:hypothetical protein
MTELKLPSFLNPGLSQRKCGPQLLMKLIRFSTLATHQPLAVTVILHRTRVFNVQWNTTIKFRKRIHSMQKRLLQKLIACQLAMTVRPVCVNARPIPVSLLAVPATWIPPPRVPSYCRPLSLSLLYSYVRPGWRLLSPHFEQIAYWCFRIVLKINTR